jgi:hypothetical protein
MRSYLDWGVLHETGTKGIYTAGSKLSVDDSRLIAWLIDQPFVVHLWICSRGGTKTRLNSL